MRSEAQREASRINGAKSRGPKSPEGKAVTKFNGLTHGLCAKEAVLPGEDPAEFEAERRGWLDDWQPMSHTRAVLVERAAVASWRLRRAVRAEAAWLRECADGAARDFDAEQLARVDRAIARFDDDPAAALTLLESDAGLDRLLGSWGELDAALEAGPAGWCQRYHARLMLLLGHPHGTDLLAAGPLPRASARLLASQAPGARPLPAGEADEAVAGLRGLAAEAIDRLRDLRGQVPDASAGRRRAAEAASGEATAEAQLRHRYEMALDRALRGTIYQLLALDRSGADLPEPAEAESEPESPPPDPSPGAEATPALAASAPGSLGADEPGSIPSPPDAPPRVPRPPIRPAAAAGGGGSPL